MNLTHHIAFASLRGMTRTLAAEFIARIGSEENFFSASERQLATVMGFNNKLLSRSYRDDVLEKAAREADFIKRNNIHVHYYTDNSFPTRLAECDDAPIILYTLGDCNLNASHIVSIVGTRHATPYGVDFTNRLVEELAMAVDDIIIVSGLAYGIDITAHKAAINCGIPTIAVLAHGLNTIYPSAHRNAAADIIRHSGMLLTDYMSCDSVHKGNFIARNRIVAALSDCTIVSESAEKGGALITANIASGYNRDVFALPGRSSDRYSAGCNRLIASNIAGLIQSADDLIDAMRWTKKATEGEQSEMFTPLSDEEEKVIGYLTTHDNASINQLCVALNYPIARLMALLIDMEFKGLILTFPGGRYRLA